MAKKKHLTFTIFNTKIPVDYYREVRKSARITIGKKAVILRLPKLLTYQEESKYFDWAKEWTKDQLAKNPDLLHRFQANIFQTGDTFQVLGDNYDIQTDFTNSDKHRISINDNLIHFEVIEETSPLELKKVMAKLLSKVMGQRYRPIIVDKVHYWNHRFFQKKINSVRMKYNSSNWGSCSTKNNINISTRLLLTPDDVIDYVIVHELAHLVEMNHSPKFWKVVKNVIPDYQDKIEWLNQHGNKCDFVKFNA